MAKVKISPGPGFFAALYGLVEQLQICLDTKAQVDRKEAPVDKLNRELRFLEQRFSELLNFLVVH
jgi:hypothetical protein